MESVPGYVSIVFILTTFATVAFVIQAIKAVGVRALPSQVLIFLLPLWLIFQAILALSGFYQNATAMPPRLVLFGVTPTLVMIGIYFSFFRPRFIEKTPFSLLTLVHIVRIPVELILLGLFFAGQVPQIMTFEGRNFDILSGILAPIVYLIAVRSGKINKPVLVAYNILGLLLLANIVSLAVLSIPSPVQQIGFDQPNRAVLFFPYIWLPSIIVPIVLFSHLASLWKLWRSRTDQ